MKHKEVVDVVQKLMQLTIYQNVIGRFHAIRKLTGSPDTEVIPFTLVLQNRSAESQRFHALFSRLVRNSCWHLVAGTMRQSKLGRSALATALAKLLQQYS